MASGSPALRARPRPTFSSRCSTRTRSSRAAYSSRIAPQPSGEQSSTAMTSMSRKDWSSTESRHSRRKPCTLKHGTMTLKRGTAGSAPHEGGGGGRDALGERDHGRQRLGRLAEQHPAHHALGGPAVVELAEPLPKAARSAVDSGPAQEPSRKIRASSSGVRTTGPGGAAIRSK